MNEIEKALSRLPSQGKVLSLITSQSSEATLSPAAFTSLVFYLMSVVVVVHYPSNRSMFPS